MWSFAKAKTNISRTTHKRVAAKKKTVKLKERETQRTKKKTKSQKKTKFLRNVACTSKNKTAEKTQNEMKEQRQEEESEEEENFLIKKCWMCGWFWFKRVGEKLFMFEIAA